DSLWSSGQATFTTVLAIADFDNDEDTDALIINERSPCILLDNQRGGKFTEQKPFGPDGAYLGDAADFDNNGSTDVLLLQKGGAFIHFNSDGKFRSNKIKSVSDIVADYRPTALEIADFDNDGLVDILVATGGVLSLCLNDGDGAFRLLSENLLPPYNDATIIVSLESGDIDNDGDLDILGAFSGGIPILLENRGGEAAHWLSVEPVGIRVPKQAIGSKIEIKTGPFYQSQTITGWPVHFGLGDLEQIDVLRITWTNGIVQNMIDVPIDTTYRFEEIVRTDASCPFLYTFDGERFQYINDVLGVAAMGVPLDENYIHIPDPDEFVKIRGDQMAPVDGKYEVRLTEELKETTYLDKVKLLVIDHPSDVTVYPNERFSEPPFIQPGIHTLKTPRHPVQAVNDRGENVLPLIMKRDLQYPASFVPSSYDGLVQPHYLEVDLGQFDTHGRIMLFLTGWIYWSSASANVAISQNGSAAFEVVSLSVPDEHGNWVIAIGDIGLPNGKNSTLPVDLTGKFPTDDHRFRLSTNMIVYWDEVAFTVDEKPIDIIEQEAILISADLRYHGFSSMTRDEYGMEEFDYHSAERFGPWRQATGRYTRFGEVTDLLQDIDDRYIIYGPGEEVAMQFDAATLSPIPDGWSRDYFLYVFGWIKDGDPNTKFSQTVTPLPFRSMGNYPYPDSLNKTEEEVAAGMADYLLRGAVETIEPLNDR
ncbi:MAG: CRTAC1 family protein, partial [candidate division Zixibacteria bacterium]